MRIDPKEMQGPWEKCYALDKHTVSSTMIGYNEFGYPEFDTQRSELGEMVYRLKYKHDTAAILPIAETVAQFITGSRIEADVIVPMPPSRHREIQPLFQIAEALSRISRIPLDTTSVSKTKEYTANERYWRSLATDRGSERSIQRCQTA